MPQNPPAFRRIYAAGPPAEVLLHALAPERMLGWTAQKPEAALALLGASERKLPVFGGIKGRGRPVSLEELLSAKVDLVVDAGTVNDGMLSTGEHTAKQLGVPYLLIDGRLDQAAEQVRLLGRLLVSPHTGKLAALAEQALAFAVQRAAERRSAAPSVYLARGEDGLETGRSRSIHTEVISMIGAKSVGDDLEGSGGLAKVSLERVLQWQPEWIVTQDAKFAHQVAANPLWRGVEAVKNRRVVLLPRLPYGWIDSPPGINRLIGIYALDATISGQPLKQQRERILPLMQALYHRQPDAAQLRMLGLA